MIDYIRPAAIFALFITIGLSAQSPIPGSIDKELVNWHNLDPKDDKVLGTSVEKAYAELLKDKQPSKMVVVAVIDAGVDIEHEDLRNKIWTNTGEIPDNGIDDDENGYVDDIHGWNFIGNARGENINEANYEKVRIIRQWRPLFEKYSSVEEGPDSLVSEHRVYRKCVNEVRAETEKYQKQADQMADFTRFFSEQETILRKYLGKEKVMLSDLEDIKSDDEDVLRARNFMRYLYSKGFSYEDYENQKKHIDTRLNKHLNPDFDPREIMGDDITSLDDRTGNPDVKGPRASHGTLVAGFIAAERNNGIGVEGIATNVEIMSLRTVPDGDEYDKDVALAIMYAVDNGADIINMSFGKYYSPQKNLVDQALAYAATRNVLLVHAAGNDAINNDTVAHYPCAFYSAEDTLRNWMVIGASSRKKGKRMTAFFSNYGRTDVDLFAPGMNVVSTMPDDKYDETQGTSFSAPIVSGVAALVWSYYPGLTAIELKDILRRSAYTKYSRKKVYRPNEQGEKEKVRFMELSSTGGLVNAYEALKLAEEFTSGRSAAAAD